MKRAGLGAFAGVLIAAAPAVASGAVPYHDDRVAGGITMCDSHGRAVTNGRLDASPFVAKVVSSFVPPGATSGTGVFVLVYQPRQGVPAGEWSGEALTASSHYTDPRHPMVEVTYGDVTLLQASQDYPPQWDHLLQLRVYSKNPDEPVYSTRYAALDIRVGPTTWQAVDPANLSCTSGTATSVARQLAPSSVVSPVPAGRHAASRPPSATATASPSASREPSESASPVPTASGTSHGSDIGLLAGLGVAVAVAAAGAFVWRRRAVG